MIFFRRTGQQNASLLRLIYAISGAAIGLFFGAFLFWMIVVSVRAVGALADAQLRGRLNSSAAGLDAFEVRRHSLPQSEESTLAALLTRLKNSLELGAIGNAITQTDPVPSKIYEMLGKVGNVVSNPESAQKFLTFPGAHELSEHPRIVALRDDPEISDMIEQRRFLDLLRDQRIIDAANDPALASQIKKFDLQRALDYAVQQK